MQLWNFGTYATYYTLRIANISSIYIPFSPATGINYSKRYEPKTPRKTALGRRPLKNSESHKKPRGEPQNSRAPARETPVFPPHAQIQIHSSAGREILREHQIRAGKNQKRRDTIEARTFWRAASSRARAENKGLTSFPPKKTGQLAGR